MAKKAWFRWYWQDGTMNITRGFDKAQMQAQIRKHGKLIAKVFECWD